MLTLVRKRKRSDENMLSGGEDKIVIRPEGRREIKHSFSCEDRNMSRKTEINTKTKESKSYYYNKRLKVFFFVIRILLSTKKISQ
tara:strand:+ start:942 stop:1196 length:255 start_codon:yes stop_codon:yes gene_type:complete